MTKRTPKPKLYRGEVVHKRLRPTEHKLSYSVFSLLVDVDRLEALAKTTRLFSLNRFNLFSLKERQHGARDGSAVKDFAWGVVEKMGFGGRVTNIQMLFYPRILGFAFNPLTVYFCCDEDGAPVLMIYEVRNTFGEDLTYVLPAGEAHGIAYAHATAKQFYVSPFNNVEGEYTFHVTRPDDAVTVGVALRTQGKPLLRTHFKGNAEPLTDTALLRAFFAYPLMTLKIVAGIHWEALKLWRKGMSLQTRPPAPEPRVIYGSEKA
ncbi:DUF1365 domain-containing protein [Pseudahrensia aquimaris]|uniref:DUF1365 domain-containing protein n=1 Tax=Pseudahrensia aquimaris TaxID=744461 RepID=A0ABW3FDP3_9HYPH